MARDWGTYQEDVEAYAGAAGGVAGAAACAAVGQPELAPICSAVGSWATEFIAGTLYEWCTSSAEAERARRRRQEVRQLHVRIDQVATWDLLNGNMLTERVNALIELHHQLWPDEVWESTAPDTAPQQRVDVFPALLLLSENGMPTQPRERGGYVMLGTPSLQDEWEALRPQMSDSVLFDRLEQEAIDIAEAIDRAYNRAVIQLTAEGAGDQAELRASRPNIRTVTRTPSRSTIFAEESAVVTAGTRLVIPEERKGYKAAAWRIAVPVVGTAAGVLLARVLRA